MNPCSTQTPNWQAFSSNFDRLASILSQSYSYYELEADPGGAILAMHIRESVAHATALC